MPAIGETFERFLHFNGQLARMIDVHAHPERMIFREHRAKLGRDALRQKNRNARADAQKFDVRNRAQAAQHFFQLIVAEEQRVAAAQSTSRTSVCCSRYLNASSKSVCNSCSPTPLTTRLRVQ